MSRGLGIVGRGIVAAFEAEPDNAFTTDDLIDRIFPRVNRAEKKHRVTVCRATRGLADRDTTYGLAYAHHAGGTLIIFNRYDLASFSMGQMKARAYPHYRGRPSTRADQAAMNALPPAEQEKQLRAMLHPGGKHHLDVFPGGWMYQAVACAAARRDGEWGTADAIEKTFERRKALHRAALGLL